MAGYEYVEGIGLVNFFHCVRMERFVVYSNVVSVILFVD